MTNMSASAAKVKSIAPPAWVKRNQSKSRVSTGFAGSVVSVVVKRLPQIVWPSLMKPGAPEAPKQRSLMSPSQPSPSSTEPAGQEKAPKNEVFDGDPTESRSREEDGAATKALPSVATAKRVIVVNMVKNLRVVESNGWRRTQTSLSPSSKLNMNFGISKQIRVWKRIGCKKMPSTDKTSENKGQITLHLSQIPQLDPLVRLMGVLDAPRPPQEAFYPQFLEQHPTIGPKRSPVWGQ